MMITSPQQLDQPITLFETEGDYLITNTPTIGIATLTADCLPMVFHAPDHNTLAVVHAGWKGSIAGIGPIVVKRLQSELSIPPSRLSIYFGPAAKPCCYQVQDDFLAHLEPFAFKDQLLTTRDNKIFFDLALLNYHLLVNAGVNPSNISREHQECTICNVKYHSHRRSKNLLRQTTMAWLK
jgi:YfiH family protein